MCVSFVRKKISPGTVSQDVELPDQLGQPPTLSHLLHTTYGPGFDKNGQPVKASSSGRSQNQQTSLAYGGPVSAGPVGAHLNAGDPDSQGYEAEHQARIPNISLSFCGATRDAVFDITIVWLCVYVCVRMQGYGADPFFAQKPLQSGNGGRNAFVAQMDPWELQVRHVFTSVRNATSTQKQGHQQSSILHACDCVSCADTCKERVLALPR